jgi:hypothetical protein
MNDILHCVGSSGFTLGLQPMSSRTLELTGVTGHLRYDRFTHDLAEILLLAGLSEGTDIHREVISVGECRDSMRQLDGQISKSRFEFAKSRRLLWSSAGQSKTVAAE